MNPTGMLDWVMPFTVELTRTSPGFGDGAEPRRDVDRPADVALRRLDGLARVHADTHAERPIGLLGVQLRCGVGDLQAAQHGARRGREHRVDRVALGLDLGALMARDRPARDVEEAADLGRRRGIAVLLGERVKPRRSENRKPR
jgi:hypothetical protein